MSAELERVIVVDEGLYQGTGLVARWLRGIGRELHAGILARAPERSGELRAGIVAEDERLGVRLLSVTVASTAPHTKYVIDGTAAQGVGYIYSTRGYANLATVGRMLSGEFIPDLPVGLWLIFSDARGGRALRVHGQRANNFLAKGYNDVAKTHRSLKPIHRGLIL